MRHSPKVKTFRSHSLSIARFRSTRTRFSSPVRRRSSSRRSAQSQGYLAGGSVSSRSLTNSTHSRTPVADGVHRDGVGLHRLLEFVTCYAGGDMSIPERTFSKWSHHQAGTAFKQAHVPIREALDAHKGLSQFKYEVFLQGSYKNDTNLGGDSDVDVVVRLAFKLKAHVVALSGEQLQEDGSHRFALERWQSFRDHAMKAMMARFGKAVKSGRKSIKVPKGKIPADADLVVTLSHKEGIGFYLPDERRWVVSYPEQHRQRGSKKEQATNNRFKRTTRMFKAARNKLVSKAMLTKEDAPSYFIECLLYNVPDGLFGAKLAPTYTGILDWLKSAKLKDFKCQNGRVLLFGPQPEQWSVKKARGFVKALQDMWDTWG